ncbi:uncharacterized protein LOC130529169 isoform X1 [Takifugu flavidus]|uniref:uncharacterized protein LOC130529169 isoform X1 n=1 Tax=Takifugu flavidus TaxID=433684 RepID=UPI002544D1CE|nr:uncharacterized protein LOC130529169 isoform X1 [Takifugu flavidus]
MSLRRRPPRHDTAEMLLWCLTLVVLATTSAGDLVILDKETKWVTLLSGSALRFKCDLNADGFHRFTVMWYFTSNQSSDIVKLNGSRINKTTTSINNAVLNYTTNATEENSGWYFCHVTAELPNHHKNTSNRTKVTITRIVEHTTLRSLVTDREVSRPFTFKNFWQWVLVGASALILIVFLLLCVLLRRRCGKKSAEQPIYANTKATNKQAQNNTLKPCNQNLRNQKLGKRYDEGKRRYEKDRGRPPL